MALEPIDWLNQMYVQLTQRAATVKMTDAYYRGDHPLPFLSKAHTEKIRNEFRQMLDDSRTNFMRLVVDVVAERLQVDGFRLSAESDVVADKDSWDIWQANNLDSLSRTAFLETLVKGVAYFSVWAPDEGSQYAKINVEDPLETIVSYTPGTNYTQRDAALKVWNDLADGVERANVYLPDGIYKFARPLQTEKMQTTYSSGTSIIDRPMPQGNVSAGGGPRWSVYKPEPFVPNKTGIVPIIPMRNRPRLLCEGESELLDHLRIQNQVNAFIFLMALAGYFGAHRQRWAVGIKMEVDEKTGELKEPFDTAIDKVWASENPEVKFGDFAQTDLTQYQRSIEQKVEHLAMVSRTPKHYMIANGQEPSGDAIKSAESGLVKKVIGKQEDFADGLEEMLRVARLFQGASDLPVDSEVVWADPAVESEAVRADATIKKYSAGLIPKEQALEDLGYSQTQISRMAAQEAAARLMNEIAAPAPSATPGGPPGAITLEPGDQAVAPPPSQVKPVTVHA